MHLPPAPVGAPWLPSPTRGAIAILHPAAALWLFALTIAGIVYGSLYPFAFEFGTVPRPQELRTLFWGWQTYQGLGNILANLILFLPFGLFGSLALSALRPFARWSLLLGGAAVLAFGLQVLQLWLPYRVADFADGALNLLGTGLGIVLAVLPWRRLPLHPHGPHPPLLPGLLLGCWLAWLWFPYVPTLDWHLLKQGLKPLLLEPRLEWLGLSRHMVGWLVFAVLWRECRLREAWLGGVIVGALLLQLLIAHNGLSLDGVLGAVLALAAWALLSRVRRPAVVVLFLLIALVLVQGLWPFEWQRSSFHWLPFRGFLAGSMVASLLSLLLKSYHYGAMVWLMYRNSRGPWVSLAVPVGLTSFVEAAQTRLGGHIAEVADPLLCVLIWSVLWVALRSGESSTRSATVA